MEFGKGEIWEWIVEDKKQLVLKRQIPVESALKKTAKAPLQGKYELGLRQAVEHLFECEWAPLWRQNEGTLNWVPILSPYCPPILLNPKVTQTKFIHSS